MERISVECRPVCADRGACCGDGRIATSGKLGIQSGKTGSLRRVPERRYTSRSQPVVGGKQRRKGSRMMRKTFLMLLGAASGAALTLMVTQPRLVPIAFGSSAKAAAADTYRQLNLFGDVFERVRADYVEKPDDSKLIESAINGMLAGLDPHSSYMEPKSVPRHAGADPRRVRRARHRGHDGGRPDQGRGPDRRHARRQGRRHGQRHHHQARRGAGAGPDPEPGGREDARPGEHQDQAHHHAQGPGQAGRGLDHPRHHPRARGALARRGRHRLHPRHPVQRADHREPEEGDHRSADADPGGQAQGLRARSAQQSGRPARSGDLGVGCVPRARRDRLDPRPQRRRDPALQRPRPAT